MSFLFLSFLCNTERLQNDFNYFSYSCFLDYRTVVRLKNSFAGASAIIFNKVWAKFIKKLDFCWTKYCFLHICVNILMKKGNSFSSSDTKAYYALNSEAKAFVK